MKLEVCVHVDRNGREIDILEANTKPANRPYESAGFVRVDELACPRCDASPLEVATFQGHSPTYTADAEFHAVGCRACQKHVGTLKRFNLSLFGEDEDRAVLHSRYRVY